MLVKMDLSRIAIMKGRKHAEKEKRRGEENMGSCRLKWTDL
jgi:hypothetical protein